MNREATIQRIKSLGLSPAADAKYARPNTWVSVVFEDSQTPRWCLLAGAAHMRMVEVVVDPSSSRPHGLTPLIYIEQIVEVGSQLEWLK